MSLLRVLCALCVFSECVYAEFLAERLAEQQRLSADVVEEQEQQERREQQEQQQEEEEEEEEDDQLLVDAGDQQAHDYKQHLVQTLNNRVLLETFARDVIEAHRVGASLSCECFVPDGTVGQVFRQFGGKGRLQSCKRSNMWHQMNDKERAVLVPVYRSCCTVIHGAQPGATPASFSDIVAQYVMSLPMGVSASDLQSAYDKLLAATARGQ